MDLNKAVVGVKQYRALPASKVDRHHETFEFLSAANCLIPKFRMLASADVQKVLYDDYTQIGYTLNSFYNETVAFIVEGKRRQTSIQTWESIFQAYANDLSNVDAVKKDESLGAMILNSIFRRSGTVRNYGSEHQSVEVSEELLSYADHEVFDLWISRDNGISDMARAMSILLKFTHP
tara:strand:+ start:857 stop:1390 length:534 start_codon:yes stop_codon:yes gene_type:complete